MQSLWMEIPHKSKDYIAWPKVNGYQSLHTAVHVSENGRKRPLMEIQIRTMEIDMLAIGGMTSHSLYESGLTDPEEVAEFCLHAVEAELAALRSQRPVSRLMGKNGDGRISIEELMEVIEELGAPGEDAGEMMLTLDSNSDGSLSSDEFQKQVEMRDEHYKTLLDEKLHLGNKDPR